jgi:fumarate reductase flavoprotein subunit
MAYIVDGPCSTCHYCFHTCPVKAIRFVGTQYAIDPEKCTDCGACEKICPAGVIHNPEKDVVPQPHEPEELHTDVVVLGGGGSGLIAAVRYKLLTGKDVVVLEKAKRPGGNTNLGHGFITRYSKKHAEAGIPDEREKAIQSILSGGDGNELSESLFRKALNAQTEFLDWLFTLGGLDEKMTLVDLRERGGGMGPFPHTPAFLDFPNRTKNVKSTDHSMGPGWMGSWVIDKMLEQCEKLSIPVLCEHRAKKLVMDEQGAFQAVIADNPGGEVTVYAKACLIATGGFARNKEVMQKLLPEFYEGVPVHSFTVASNTGDAISMAEEIGAKMDFEHVKIPMFGPVHHPFSHAVMQLSSEPEGILVDLDGKRFMNEDRRPDMERRSPLEDVRDKVAYVIFDSKIRDKMGADLLERTAHDKSLAANMAHWSEELEYETTLDTPVKKADTIEELAKLAGIDPDGLAAQIERYNGYCEKGADEELGKQPQFLMPIEQAPFYAVYQMRFNEGAEGGIVNDDELRVVKEDGSVFEGLYIAGDPCRGLLKKTDEGGKFGEMPWAVASGYMVAENLAKYTGE